ncbi:MAG: WD40 repeat domain-containing protein [Cyanobacteria bacterium P01_D01_bin.115]
MQRSQDNSAVEQTAQSIMMRGLEVSREINLLQSHEGGVTKVVFSHDGSLLASGGEDGTLRLWDIKTGQPIGKPLEGHETPIDSIAFTRDNRRLVSGDASNEILIWDIETQQVVAQPLKSYTGEFSTHALSLGGSRIAVVRDNVVDKNIQGFGGRHLDRVQLFDTMTGTQLTEPLDGHPGDIHAIAFSPDGKYFATGVGSMHADTDLGDNTVRVWDAEAGELVDEAMAQDGRISYIAFSSGNQIIVSNLPGDGVYGSLRLWQPLPYQIGWRLGNNHPESFATAAVFSPTRNLVVAVIGKTIQQLDPELALDSPAMQLVDEPFRGHTNLVSSVAISPDGQYIASSSLEGKIRLWAAEYDANSDDSSQASIERLNVACDRLRYHPMLNKPETLTADSEFIEIANRARSSCQKQFWQEE